MHGFQAAPIFWKKMLLAKFLATGNGCKQSLSTEKLPDVATLSEHQDFKKPKLQVSSLPWIAEISTLADCNNNQKCLPLSALTGNIAVGDSCTVEIKRKTTPVKPVSDNCPEYGTGETKRKLPVKPDNHQEYRISPDPAETICAGFHQKSGRHGLSNYRGSQCTSMALSAVMVSKTLLVDTWRTKDLDSILRFGDRFHGELLNSIDRKSIDPKLALHEIPSGDLSQCRVPVPSYDTKWFDKNYNITQDITISKSEEYYGQVCATKDACAKESDLGDTPIEAALDAILSQTYDGVVITVGNVSGAIVKDCHGRVRYFDSHCNNKIGRMNLDGTAVLLAFDNTQKFVRYIRKRETKSNCRYEMVGINIHS